MTRSAFPYFVCILISSLAYLISDNDIFFEKNVAQLLNMLQSWLRCQIEALSKFCVFNLFVDTQEGEVMMLFDKNDM